MDMTNELTPRQAIGFLSSCVRSGEPLSPEDESSVSGALEKLTALESLTGRLADRLKETEYAAHRAGPREHEACLACEGTGGNHDADCGVLSRRKANEELLAEYEAIKP
jgi:hypothetical protein